MKDCFMLCRNRVSGNNDQYNDLRIVEIIFLCRRGRFFVFVF